MDFADSHGLDGVAERGQRQIRRTPPTAAPLALARAHAVGSGCRTQARRGQTWPRTGQSNGRQHSRRLFRTFVATVREQLVEYVGGDGEVGLFHQARNIAVSSLVGVTEYLKSECDRAKRTVTDQLGEPIARLYVDGRRVGHTDRQDSVGPVGDSLQCLTEGLEPRNVEALPSPKGDINAIVQ